MTKVDQLIEAFKAFKEELNKNMNGSMNPGMLKPNSTTGTSGGQGGMYRSEDMEKQMISASPGGSQDAMMVKFDKNGQWRMEKCGPMKKEDENYISRDGKNREANPKLRDSDIGPGGKVHKIPEIKKEEGTNEEAASSKPHNKAKFKVMPMEPEKSVKHLEAKGLPYDGKDKDVKKGDKIGHIQGNESKGNDENKAPGRGQLGV